MSIQELQRRVTYLTYAIQNLIDASGNYAKLNEENEFTEPNLFSTLTLTDYIPRYALSNVLRNFMNNQSVEFYGDSITAGVGLSNPLTENWAYVLCQKFTNSICVNNAVGGSIPIDFTNTGATSTKAMIPAHVSGRTTFLDFGTNVIQRLTSVPTSQPNSGQLDGAFTGHVNSLENMINFCMLPDSKKFNARSGANVTRTGTWTFNPMRNTYATGTSTANDFMTCTNLNGRYVGVSFLINYAPASFSNFVVELDGVQYGSSARLVSTMNSTQTGLATIWQPQDLIIDTGVSTNHTIKITNLGTGTNITYVVYFFYFDQNDPTINPVFVLEQEVANYTATAYIAGTSHNQGSLTRAMMWYTCIKCLVYRFRVYYGLPIYFIDNTFANILALGCVDQIHPNKQWHEQIANRVYDFLTRGELAYELL
jgi:hypothetical protein